MIMAKKADVAKEVKAKILEEKKKEEALAEEKVEEKKPEKTVEKPVEKKAEAKPVEAKKPEKKAEAKPEKAEAKKPEKKKEEKKIEEVLEERVITIPLREAWKSPRTKRAKTAIRVLRDQLKRHVKKEIKFDISVNKAIWARGIKNPPRKIKVNVKIMKDSAKAYFIE